MGVKLHWLEILYFWMGGIGLCGIIACGMARMNGWRP